MITPEEIEELKKTFVTHEHLQEHTDIIVKELRSIFLMIDKKFDEMEARLEMKLDAAIVELQAYRIILGEHEVRLKVLETA